MLVLFGVVVERKINWSLVASILFGLIISLMGWIVQQNERRLVALEEWRDQHEHYSRDQVIRLSERLAMIETKLDQVLKTK